MRLKQRPQACMLQNLNYASYCNLEQFAFEYRSKMARWRLSHSNVDVKFDLTSTNSNIRRCIMRFRSLTRGASGGRRGNPGRFKIDVFAWKCVRKAICILQTGIQTFRNSAWAWNAKNYRDIRKKWNKIFASAANRTTTAVTLYVMQFLYFKFIKRDGWYRSGGSAGVRIFSKN